jgi:hypothetical protein
VEALWALPLAALLLWLLVEVAVRAYLELPLATDFYGSVSRSQVRALQQAHGVKLAAGPGWLHLGWVADPERERYRIESWIGGTWQRAGEARFGSFLVRDAAGRYRVWAEPKGRGAVERLIGEVSATPAPDRGAPPLYRPEIAGPWQSLFRPREHGHYVNDHDIYRDAEGRWRLVGITSRSDGDFRAERYFSRIDVYQSFDLEHWQYIGAALDSSRGSERNSPFASMESPVVVRYAGCYYLSFTYNNDSFFWPGLLLLFKIWPRRDSYNDTLVVHSDNPYCFGSYRGRRRTPSLVAELCAHAPAYCAEEDTWFITTAGWPWAATLTSGEVAVAPLRWLRVE